LTWAAVKAAVCDVFSAAMSVVCNPEMAVVERDAI
jgi:hypothetical protein